VAASRTVYIAGAGIGGLTAALALAQSGLRAVIFEQANALQEVGAGIQLSPNATRILNRLGLAERLTGRIVAPEAISVRSARSGAEIIRIRLGADAEFRYGAPFWTLHRGDLQAALIEAAGANPDVVLTLGSKVEDFAVHARGLTLQVRRGGGIVEERGIALVGADGLWSTLRARLGDDAPPRFAGRKAWRATVPAEAVSDAFRAPVIHLWLGHRAHLVHYPVRGGRLINIVAITRDSQAGIGWGEPAAREQLLRFFPNGRWAAAARALLDIPERWLTWALYDRPPLDDWGHGPVTLLGDAAHPMLPFLAQGAGMAIEDAAILAQCFSEAADPSGAMRRYEGLRRQRTARAQRAARENAFSYHLGFPAAQARDLILRQWGGRRLLQHYDWLYDWWPA
jgi:salicylate hydroxylase